MEEGWREHLCGIRTNPARRFPDQGVCDTADVQGCEGEEREGGSRIGRRTASGLKVGRSAECALKSKERLQSRFPYGKDGGNRDAVSTFRKHFNVLQGL